MIAVNLLIVLVLCTVVGAFTGLVLGGLFDHLYWQSLRDSWPPLSLSSLAI